MDKIRRGLILSPLALAAMAPGVGLAQTPAPVPPMDPKHPSHPKAWPKPAGTIDLWPTPPAGQTHAEMKEVVEETTTDPSIHFRRVQGIKRPRVAVFPAAKPSGGAMLIIPGGGFWWNYFDHEGYQLAEILNRHGITCFVLFYRLANDGWDNRAEVGTIDAQRAMRVIRAHARHYHVDPARLGVMGFSAGGFITASLATRHAQALYTPVDAADQLDARPFLAAPIYAVQSLDPAIAYSGAGSSLFGGAPTAEQIARHSPDRNVDGHTPPTFLAHAEDDDGVPVANSLAMRSALKAAGVTVETHLFASGGHGFGVKPAPKEPYHLWPELFVNFARRQGLTG